MTGTAAERPRFCYLVFCHRDPSLVRRAAASITGSSETAHVVLRHDRSSALTLAALPDRTTELVSEIRITWGSWNMVAAQLEALEYVRETLDPDWIVLISGQDYPVRDLARWETELAAGDVDAVIAARQLDPLQPETRTMDRDDWLVRRYTYRWRALPRANAQRWAPPVVRRVARGVWYRYLARLQVGWAVNEMPRGLPWLVGLRRRRRTRAALAPWYGEQWLALGRRAVDAVVSSARDDHALRRRFEQSMIPDESYFQTVVCSDPSLKVLNRPVSWKHFKGSEAHPRMVVLEDLPAARESGRPFVRKVDLSRPEVLAALDDAVAQDRGVRENG